MTHRTRRALLVATAGAVAMAGCADGTSSPPETEPSTEQPPPSTGTSASDDTGFRGEVAAGLDLREANVVAVEWDGAAGEAVELAVTLFHDDDGEDGYANWWQVETLAGERLGRRDLLHAHGTEPFTRSARFAVPGGADCLVVRGHDRTHGYGGRAMLVNLATGATGASDQGSEPRPFSADDCP